MGDGITTAENLEISTSNSCLFDNPERASFYSNPVKELEESRNSLFQENQLLMENISILQSQFQLLERKPTFSVSSKTVMTKHVSEDQDLNTQMEAACALVEKLITENAELVEKVNELLHIKLDRQRSVTAGFDPAVAVAEAATVGDYMYESSGVAPIQLEELLGSYETDEYGEIEQIALDEKEVQDLELQAAVTVERASVTLSDAPLVGAPFRLISFVAKYVSGADLVDKSTLNLGQ
ncbi:hypothetical protein HHK36_018740 [Tetracentron sinense]|uniref:Uncharacterized protein n=1 Tax=Tetracentron sinense TaxID=13715 RepID=A0A835DC57_TETSI|nr:hypothetical protein HHK36_018740 [Tetracentron sinense]